MKSMNFWVATVLTGLLLLLILTGCNQATPAPEEISLEPTATSTQAPPVTLTPTLALTPTPKPVSTATPTPTPIPTTSTPSPAPTATFTPSPMPSPTFPPIPTPTPTPTRRPLVSSDDVEINAAYGTIEERYTGTTDHLIILIGENHASYQVQQNVARIAEQLLAEYDIRLLLIEGYGEAIDTGFFDAIPDPAIRREAAWAFLDTTEISGIEYAALVSGPDVKTIGIENMELWSQSKEALDSEPDLEDPAIQQAWEEMINEVVELIEQLSYTDELDQKVNAFVEDELDFVDLYDYLLATAAEESVSTVTLEARYQEFQEALNPVLRLACLRDLPMVENSLAAMEQDNTGVAILLVGHAHYLGTTKNCGLSNLFKDQGVSFVYILPGGTEEETTEEENQYYEAQLNEIPFTFEAWLNHYFKPKPSIVRPNHQAGIEAVGKIAFLSNLAQAGLSWDQISAAYGGLLSTGKVHIRNRFDVTDQFSVYPARVKGKTSNETFVFATSASGSEPKISYQSDVIARWQIGGQWITAIKGRSADVLIRRGIVAQNSEPGRPFYYAYPIDEGNSIAWQAAGAETTISDISWDEFNDLLDSETPVDGREEKEAMIQAALGGNGKGPPLGGDGPPILFPDEEPDIPNDEGNENYDEGSYFPPSGEGEDWDALDSAALAIGLGRLLDTPVYLDGNPTLAKDNLNQQTPVRVENLGVVVDEASLDDEQRQFAQQIPQAIADKGITISDEQISYSLNNFPAASNVVLITAENDAELEERLTQLGEAGQLRDKYILLLTCGDEGLRDFSSWIVQEYGMTGLHVYRDKIHANTLPHIVSEVYQVAQEEPGLAPAELINRAVKQALERELENELRQNMDRLRNGWNQLSEQFDLQSEELSVV